MKKKKSGFAMIIPFDQYVKTREKFDAEHPKAKILKEIETLSMGIAEVPNPLSIGSTMQQQCLMIAFAIIFEEDVPQEKKSNLLLPN